MTILEVHNEKLHDLLAGTSYADEHGQVIICETRDKRDRRKHSERMESWQQGKLEIRTNIDGNTVVQGLVSIPIESFEDATTVWRETISHRAERLKQSGLDVKNHDKNSNIITTFHITSVNIATGVGTEGRLQFVDMAASDIAHRVKKMEDAVTTDEDKIHFYNKSIDALNDVVNARCQFDRSVPYRNSTLTHLLRDSLEADAKVLLLCCVSSDPSNLYETIGTLRFGTRMQKVSIGKATKHIVGNKE
jgi:kinesin family protein C2/C3